MLSLSRTTPWTSLLPSTQTWDEDVYRAEILYSTSQECLKTWWRLDWRFSFKLLMVSFARSGYQLTWTQGKLPVHKTYRRFELNFESYKSIRGVKLTSRTAAPEELCPESNPAPSTQCQKQLGSLEHILSPWAKRAEGQTIQQIFHISNIKKKEICLMAGVCLMDIPQH